MKICLHFQFIAKSFILTTFFESMDFNIFNFVSTFEILWRFYLISDSNRSFCHSFKIQTMITCDESHGNSITSFIKIQNIFLAAKINVKRQKETFVSNLNFYKLWHCRFETNALKPIYNQNSGLSFVIYFDPFWPWPTWGSILKLEVVMGHQISLYLRNLWEWTKTVKNLPLGLV